MLTRMYLLAIATDHLQLAERFCSREKLDFDEDGIMVVFYMGLPHLYM